MLKITMIKTTTKTDHYIDNHNKDNYNQDNHYKDNQYKYNRNNNAKKRVKTLKK